MADLPEHCAPCADGTRALGPSEAEERLQACPSWTLELPRLKRSFELPGFRQALAWVNRVGMLAEEEGHHPDFHITRWNQVELVLWTHTLGGLSDNDFVMAREIDRLWERSPAAGAAD